MSDMTAGAATLFYLTGGADRALQCGYGQQLEINGKS